DSNPRCRLERSAVSFSGLVTSIVGHNMGNSSRHQPPDLPGFHATRHATNRRPTAQAVRAVSPLVGPGSDPASAPPGRALLTARFGSVRFWQRAVILLIHVGLLVGVVRRCRRWGADGAPAATDLDQVLGGEERGGPVDGAGRDLMPGGEFLHG